MNDNQAPQISEPKFDPHREGKRGFWIGAVGALVVIGLWLWLF